MKRSLRMFCTALAISMGLVSVQPAQAALIFKNDSIGAGAIIIAMFAGPVALVTSGKPYCISVTETSGPITHTRAGCNETEYVKGVFEGALIGLGAAVVLGILDADAQVQTDQLAQELAARYSFVDNAEAIRELATRMQQKLAIASLDREAGILSMSEEEVRDAFAGVSMRRGEIEKIISDLR